MLSKIMSCALVGIDGLTVMVEVNTSSGNTYFEIVGLPDTSVRESRERVRTAMHNAGYKYPYERVIVNLAPADQKKEGPAYDLPIALCLLTNAGVIKPDRLKDICVLGELSLDGSVRPVRGVLPMVIYARSQGVKSMLVPKANLPEVKCIDGIDIYGVENLNQAVAHLRGDRLLTPLQTVCYEDLRQLYTGECDFSHVKGQRNAKRALEIAAAGGHNVLMLGPPGSGKTLMARCMPTILPGMSFEEALETTRIHSVAGTVPPEGLVVMRPFRAPHHSASNASLVGGGPNAIPGEISKAHNGVLFLDELPEFKRDLLEALRQPLEDGFVTITRVNAQSTYPADFMLVCAMNPCPCGNLGSRTKPCRCNPNEIKRYLGRISGPLLDRIDMHIEVESIPAEKLSEDTVEENSATIRARVEAAREVQRARYINEGEGLRCNAQLNARTLNRVCKMSPEVTAEALSLSNQLQLSNRAYTRVLKVARTIADLEGSEPIKREHVLEAIHYRTLDRKYWG